MISNNPELVYFILSYKRPVALNECIRTVFENTKVKPDLVYILDDASGGGHQAALANFAERNTNDRGVSTNVILNNVNMGIGNQFETIFNLVRQLNPSKFVIIEGDYIFRNEWMEDINDAFDKLPYSIACSLMDHADMYLPEKYNGLFVDIMKEHFGEDIDNRQYMYNHQNPDVVETNRGKLEYFKISNSCGAMAWDYQRLKKFIFDDLGKQKEFWSKIEEGCNKGGDRSRASDGCWSSSLTYFHWLWMKEQNIDTSKNSAFINILPSLAFHAASQGVNGKLDPNYFPDGTSFPGVNSGSFPTDYNSYKRQ